MDEDSVVEAIGESVGEAKWTAIRELERRFPGLDRDAVRFEVLSEGERGLMGVGREPARVIAKLTAIPEGTRAVPRRPEFRPARAGTAAPRGGRGSAATRPRPRRDRAPAPTSEAIAPPEALGERAMTVYRILTAVCAGLGAPAAVRVTQDGEELTAELVGDDLGVLIGKRGHTMDALQHLLNAIVHRNAPDGESGPLVIVDAQGYRRRRQEALHDAADRVATEVESTGRPVEMEPMSAPERKIVHVHLQDRSAIVTESAGKEPNRFVVVRAADPD
jgi:spoIIIJ-associated protein